MPDYSKGKIYKITSPLTDKIYIGSTCLDLKYRLSGHVADYKRFCLGLSKKYISSFDIIKLNEYNIELVENYSCKNKYELLKKEYETILKYKDIVVNIVKPDPYLDERILQEYKNNPKPVKEWIPSSEYLNKMEIMRKLGIKYMSVYLFDMHKDMAIYHNYEPDFDELYNFDKK